MTSNSVPGVSREALYRLRQGTDIPAELHDLPRNGIQSANPIMKGDQRPWFLGRFGSSARLTSRYPVNDTFADHDHRCMGAA